MKQLVEETAPTLEKTCKWGNGCWVKEGLPLIFIHVEPDHVQLGFFAGATLDDPEDRLRGNGKYVRHIRIETDDDIEEDVFSPLIEEAVNAPPYR